VIEMMAGLGLKLIDRADFHVSRTFAAVNTRSRAYRADSSAIESALIFGAPRS
jgi:hypothetical protein